MALQAGLVVIATLTWFIESGNGPAVSPNPATPFPTGRKSTAERLDFFLPVGNFARISLTAFVAYVLA